MIEAARPRFRRLAGWQTELTRFLEERRDMPFAWGENDCALHVADWVLRMTGEDPGADYRGRYRSAAGAARVMRRIAGGGVVAVATRAFGPPAASPFLARRGDIAAVRGRTADGHLDLALGVVDETGGRVASMGFDRQRLSLLAGAEHVWLVG